MKKYWRRLPFWPKIILAIIISVVAYSPLVENKLSNDLYEVIKVVDGDTLKINYEGKEESLRLIGVDTPESVHPDEQKNNLLGKYASEYTKKNLEGKKITIEFDVQSRDKYGRLLAYVYLDGIMFNKTLLEEGYAQIATYPPNTKYVDDFIELERLARNNNAGLWNEKNCQE